jgi:hypothetical protein
MKKKLNKNLYMGIIKIKNKNNKGNNYYLNYLKKNFENIKNNEKIFKSNLGTINAKDNNITIITELINPRLDHPDIDDYYPEGLETLELFTEISDNPNIFVKKVKEYQDAQIIANNIKTMESFYNVKNIKKNYDILDTKLLFNNN